MNPIDDVFGMDWTDSTYLGDGVYLKDSSERTGINSVALRTDRNMGATHQVIVLEDGVFADLMHEGKKMLGFGD